MSLYFVGTYDNIDVSYMYITEIVLKIEYD